MTTSADFDWDRVQADFPVNEHLIWLNNAGTTPLGTPIRKEVERFLAGYARHGLFTEEKTYPRVKASIYRYLADLLCVDSQEFALIHNTAEGMNLLSRGLSLGSGDEILILENEYPSNVYPWEHWEEKGVALRRIPCSGGPERFLEDFRTALGNRARVAAISAVHWCTGMPLPLREVGRLCAERGIELVVDGSQGVGLLDLDLRACGVGYLACSAWKWLLGPLGLGVLYISKDKLERVKPIFKGTESVANPQDYLPYQTGWKSTTERFAYSTGNFNDWVYFEASLGYLAGIGFPRVRERILFLANHLTRGLREMGFTLLSDVGGYTSGIVVAERAGWDGRAAAAALKARGIIVAERLGRIRLAPHVYNSIAQLDRVLAEMAAFA